jgi:hypothetical protein
MSKEGVRNTLSQPALAASEREFVAGGNVQCLGNVFNGMRPIASYLKRRKVREIENVFGIVGIRNELRVGVTQQGPQAVAETVFCFQLERMVRRAA